MASLEKKKKKFSKKTAVEPSLKGEVSLAELCKANKENPVLLLLDHYKIADIEK